MSDTTTAQNLQDRAADIQNRAMSAGRKALDFVDAKRETAAQGLDSAASAIHGQAERLGRFAETGHSAGQAMEDAADYVRERSGKEMMDDLVSTVRSSPTTSLILVGFVGFMVGRWLFRR